MKHAGHTDSVSMDLKWNSWEEMIVTGVTLSSCTVPGRSQESPLPT